jgi:hypothetical protein
MSINDLMAERRLNDRAHEQHAEIKRYLDFVRNVAGFDDGLLTTPDLNLLRATLREWRSEARAILDRHGRHEHNASVPNLINPAARHC